MIAYKLFNIRKDGSIGSLFINKKEKLPFNTWLPYKDCPTKGYKNRPGWHCMTKPYAPHLSMKNRKWFKVELGDIDTYIYFKRPENQGGTWILSQYIKILGETND